MAQQYAKDQPSGFVNKIQNIAIIGSGGQIGSVSTKHLISENKHKLTGITRADSKTPLPSGLHETKAVDYDNHGTVVEAMKGQDVLIVALSISAPPDLQNKLANAAAEAGVQYILPNEFGSDQEQTELGKETFMGPPILGVRKHIEEVGKGKTHWIGLSSSVWYEFSLARGPTGFGFDFDKKEAEFSGDGNVKINTSTWPQVARAVASLMSMKILPEDENDKAPCLSHWNDKPVLFTSFLISQRDMLHSILRVTGDNEGDWKIKEVDAKERYNRGMKMIQEGDMYNGFGIILYSRIFYPAEEANFSAKVQNKLLGLPEESLDEATKVGLQMNKDWASAAS